MSDRAIRQPAPVVQFLQLLGLWAVGYLFLGPVIGSLIIAIIWGPHTVVDILSMTNTHAPGFLGAFRLLITFASPLFGFLAPALLFNYWLSKEPHEHIRIGSYTPVILILLAVVFMVCLLPTIDITAYFNQKMTLPAPLGGIDKWIHDMEKVGAAQFKVLLDMKTPFDLTITLIIVAVLPAIAEEFFFRGCMLPIFQRSTHSTHAAVLITAFIFSFMHLEFLGFVPRFLLGVGLGYMFAWSGTIWPSVVVHFVNNALSVVAEYLYQHKYMTADPDSGQLMFQTWVYSVSLVAAVLLLLLFHKITVQKQLLTYGEELD